MKIHLHIQDINIGFFLMLLINFSEFTTLRNHISVNQNMCPKFGINSAE